VTGRPTPGQAAFEIKEAWRACSRAPTPWSDFEFHGKWYYNSRAVAVAAMHDPIARQPGEVRTQAFIAYGPGGLVAVDVTRIQRAGTGRDPIEGRLLGYLPPVPTNGMSMPLSTGSGPYPRMDAEHLQEGGFTDVVVRGDKVYATDHFGGLVVASGAYHPEWRWKGAGAPYDNDTNGTRGDGVPAYESVTSFDMRPQDPSAEESPPAWLLEAPSLLATGEIGGHAQSLALAFNPRLGAVGAVDPDGGVDPESRLRTTGSVDVVVAYGAGGTTFLDLFDLEAYAMQDRFAVSGLFPTTDEMGADEHGSPTMPISLGRTDGIATSNGYVYAADGPHGVIVWSLTNPAGWMDDDPHVVANTLQGKEPKGGIFPARHARGVVLGESGELAFTSCRESGLRCLPVSDVQAGKGVPWAPLLICPERHDVFEHRTATGSVAGMSQQDHALDVALRENLAFVADGYNGLTIYDLTKDPSDMKSGFVVSCTDASGYAKPLGRTTGVALWEKKDKRYAILAAGRSGVGVIDVTDPAAPEVLKVFEPIRIDAVDAKVGRAGNVAVDVVVAGDQAFVSYGTSGVFAYALEDLIAPLPPSVDPTRIWMVQGRNVVFDHRPTVLARFRLQDLAGFEDVEGGARYMTRQRVRDELHLFVAYGKAGAVEIDWTRADAPVLSMHFETVGHANAVAVGLGRVLVADHDGGMALFE
jgi:hypothetical protein